MTALGDFMKSMKSPESIKILDFQQFSTFWWHPWSLVTSTTPKRPDNVEKHKKFGSDLFRAFPRGKHSRTSLDGCTGQDRTIRFHEIFEIFSIHQNPSTTTKRRVLTATVFFCIYTKSAQYILQIIFLSIYTINILAQLFLLSELWSTIFLWNPRCASRGNYHLTN